jgi:hypothetical protein
MCDQGNKVLFHSKCFKVMDGNTWDIVIKEVRTSRNVYVLEEGKTNVALVKLMRVIFGTKD